MGMVMVVIVVVVMASIADLSYQEGQNEIEGIE